MPGQGSADAPSLDPRQLPQHEVVPHARRYDLRVRVAAPPNTVRDKNGRELAWTFDGLVNVEAVEVASQGAEVVLAW